MGFHEVQRHPGFALVKVNRRLAYQTMEMLRQETSFRPAFQGPGHFGFGEFGIIRGQVDVPAHDPQVRHHQNIPEILGLRQKFRVTPGCLAELAHDDRRHEPEELRGMNLISYARAARAQDGLSFFQPFDGRTPATGHQGRDACSDVGSRQGLWLAETLGQGHGGGLDAPGGAEVQAAAAGCA